MSMTYEEYIAHDGLALAAAVRTGDVTAMELLEVAVARLEAVNQPRAMGWEAIGVCVAER